MFDAHFNEADARFFDQVELICDSYLRLVGAPLFPEAPRGGRSLGDLVWSSDRVVLSHDGASDPCFNYGNRAALELWEMSLDEFVGLPSRYSAEEAHRSDRERMLRDVAERGVSTAYTGVRASKTGRRFMIEQAVVFNLVDEAGTHRGQAATFSRWTYL